ncbi:long-chain-fatty-acid--CoA ligase [Sulfoacidibacillus thermotolerans]|uniref:O-succinylbenzoate--CoA ligase n=1 Tax=Sulfoacidibacillus thermotolerans TaxID=1765684 RepID=A0A2U3D862_SULT2|nr:long-chain-fatty-acid--CoA ligase [Sulfoacidibacillus thermotolerans]PWI57467.1 o-succinylbenzoate--CoA ligase [Sulfoacidibacillus thermotolerans]
MITPLTPLDWKRRATKLYPKKIAIIDGPLRFTYQEFNDRTWKLTNALHKLGLGTNDHIAVMLPNIHQMLECFYGIAQLGAVMVPINTRLNAEEIAYILEHSDAKAMIADREYMDLMSSMKDSVQNLQIMIEVVHHSSPNVTATSVDYEYEQLLETATATPFSIEIDENQALSINYTSGTTSRPKGVILTHRNNYMNAADVLFHMRIVHEDQYLHILPMFHANGWGSVWAFTAVGATHVCLRKVDPELILQLFMNEEITVAFGAPTVINMLLHAPQMKNYKPKRAIRFATAGSPPPAAVIEKSQQLLNMEITHVYGLTEVSPLISYCEWKSSFNDLSPTQIAEIKARQGVEMVHNGETKVVLPDGQEVLWNGKQIGEIVTRGNVVMAGYYKQPEETAKAIRDGWFYTGDLAVVHPDGYIQIVDRAKDVIISGGENISSIEVEDILYQHPAVMEAGVVAIPHEKWGEVPKAFIIVKPGETVTADELNEWCRERLAHFKTPKEYEFVTSLPRTSTGKLQKFRLRG